MIVTVTERETFKRCRRLWDFGSKNRQGLTKLIPKGALSIGKLVHEALADWVLNPNDDLVDICTKHASTSLVKVCKAYQQQVGAPISEAELEPFYDAVATATGICKNYQAHWKTPLPQDFVVIRPEQQLLVPIPGTDHHLEGKLDGILQDSRGRVYVLERKTYGQRPNEHALQMNDQFLAYIWALSQLDLGPVGGLAYDGMWKRGDPPRGKSLSDLFLRILITRPPEELEEFAIHLVWEANEMASNPPLYINRPWQGCWDCDFEPLCASMSRGEDWEYIKQKMYTKRENLDEDLDQAFAP